MSKWVHAYVQYISALIVNLQKTKSSELLYDVILRAMESGKENAGELTALLIKLSEYL